MNCRRFRLLRSRYSIKEVSSATKSGEFTKFILSTMYVLTPTLAFEIAETDLPDKLEWREALQSGLFAGDRWRLPTKEELDEIYRLHQKAIGGLKFDNYWSSDGYNNYSASAKDFTSGNYGTDSSFKNPPRKCNVRLVRNI